MYILNKIKPKIITILSKVSRIKKAINGINVKSDVIKSFENLQEAISVLSNSKLNNFETFATTVRQLSDIDGKGLGAMFKSFRNVRDNDIDNIYLLGEALKDLKKELDELDKTRFSGSLSQLESILHSSEALKSLATIVQKTGTNLEKAKQSVSNVSKDITKDVDKIKASIEGLDRGLVLALQITTLSIHAEIGMNKSVTVLVETHAKNRRSTRVPFELIPVIRAFCQ